MSDIYHAGGGNTWPVKMQEVKAPEDGRCPLTDNPCGTDTWPDPIVNPACPCQEKVVSKESLEAVIERLEMDAEDHANGQFPDDRAIREHAADLSRLIEAYRQAVGELRFIASAENNTDILIDECFSSAKQFLTSHTRSGESDD